MNIKIDYMSYHSDLQVKKEDSTRKVFDLIRKKWLVLTPEEFVRQLLVLYLTKEKGYNENRISIEKKVVFNQMPKRCDILIYNKKMEPLMLVECKAAEVPINQSTFEQIARYNYPLRVPYLLVTNGLSTFCCKMSYEDSSFDFLSDIPDYM